MKQYKISIFKGFFLSLFVSTILLGACKKENTDVFIRVENASSYTYDHLIVSTSGGTFNYGTVKPNAVTSYQSFVFAYSYALIQLEINGQEFKIIPTDYSGEERLESGYYTYIIDVVDHSNSELSLSVVKD